MAGSPCVVLCALLALFAIASPTHASAAPADLALEAQQGGVQIEAVPLFAGESPTNSGWLTLLISVSNTGPAPMSGSIELASTPRRNERELLATAPFALAPGARSTLQMPVHDVVGHEIEASALGDDDTLLGRSKTSMTAPAGPQILDFSTPSRLAVVLRGERVSLHRAPSWGVSSTPGATIATPRVDPETGDRILPLWSSGYAPVTLVLATTEQVVDLPGPALDALGAWLLAGGSLALVDVREADLDQPPLLALFGGRAARGAVRPALRRRADFEVPKDDASPYQDRAHASVETLEVRPERAVKETFLGHAGANLRPTRWGTAATYGLGEVHLLAFDPTRAPGVDDRWTQLKVLDLLGHAWDRQSHIAVPSGASALDRAEATVVRQVLDPNTGNSWAIGLSAILLLLYALITGPINFSTAARAGRPLRALALVPVFAGVAMLGIVTIGAVAKGGSGKARHLSVIEAGAGMPRASVVRFRAFYASSADALTVHGKERHSVLDAIDNGARLPRRLTIDREGARLEGFMARPWETVLVREDSTTTLGGGVHVVETGASIEIRNRLGRDLVAVVVGLPDASLHYFSRIADGARATPSASTRIATIHRGGSHTGLTELQSHLFRAEMTTDARGVVEAWDALEKLKQGQTDWWPEGTPALLAQIDGGEGNVHDAGLRLDHDRLLIRIVGVGGRP